MMHDSQSETYVTHIVVGAGFQGLPIIKKLRELGEDVLCLDRNPDVGGIWHTGAYDTAHIISSRDSTGFTDFPMPERYPDFPSRNEMQRYFRSYAETFSLLPFIRFGTSVIRIRPAAAGVTAKRGRWLVETDNGARFTCQTVTLANGHHTEPRIANYPGTYSGETLWSNDYRTPAVFKGKKVLVVGSGNTACDAAVDASLHGLCADVSVRDGVYFFPRTFMGKPLDQALDSLPFASRDWAQRLMASVVHACAVGDPRRYGLPKPTFRILDRHPVVNSELLRRIRLGRVGVKPEIAAFDGRRVSFVDGTSAEYDLVFWAIGYRISMPMLDPEDRLLDWEDDLPVLFLMMMSARARGLFISGLGQARSGGGPLFEGAGYLSARMAAFDARDPQGIMAKLSARPELSTASRLLGFKAVDKADTRSRSLSEHRTALAQLSRMLDAIGCPDAVRRTGRSNAASNLELAARPAEASA